MLISRKNSSGIEFPIVCTKKGRTDMRISSKLQLISRRQLLGASVLAGFGAIVMPRIALSQGNGPIPIGTLTPLTGAGANYGGRMRDAVAGVIAAANEQGGILGRQIHLVSEDDETNPEAGVAPHASLSMWTKSLPFWGCGHRQ